MDEYAKILNGIGPTSEEEADSSNKNATSAALTMYEQTPASKSTTTFVLMNPDTDDESDEEEQLATQIEECFLNSDDEEEVVEEEYDKEYSEELYEGSDGAFEDEVDASSLTNCNSQHELSSQSSPLSSASTTNTALRIKAPIRAIKQIDELVFQSSSIRGRRSHRTNLSVTATTIDRNDGQLTEDEVVVDEVADEVADEWKSFRSVFEKISEHRPSLDPPPPPDARLLEALFSSDEAALESILQELEQKRVLEEEKTQNQLQQSPSSYTSPSSLLLDTPLHTSSSPNHIALPASVSTDYIHVGRPIKVETSSRDIRAVLWMYESPTKAKSTATKTATAPSSSSSSSWFSLATSLLTSANTSSSLSVTNLADEDEEQDEFLCDYLPVQSSHFPLSLKSIIPIFDLLGMVSPSVYGKHLQTLSDFFNVQLPPGFPVQIELPIGPPVVPLSLLLTFGEIKMRNPRYKPATPTTASTPFLDDALFVIPGRKQGYRIGEVIMDATSSESEINQ